MSYGEIGWIIFLAGLPFAHLLFRPLDPWHGQAVWAQGWIVILFGMSLWKGIKWVENNRPLGSLTIWLLLSYCWVSFLMIKNVGVYPVLQLQGLVHFFLILMFYISACSMWTTEFVQNLLEAIAYSAIAVIIYGYCQIFSIDQFFNNIDDPLGKDVVGGTIGNPTHFAAYLSFVLPILIIQNKWYFKLAAGLAYILVLFTQSSTGILISSIIITLAVFRSSVNLGILTSLAFVAAGYWLLVNHWQYWLNPSGRLEVWPVFYEMFKEGRSITGSGLGFVMEYSRGITEGVIFKWRHVHNEYLQMAIEMGIVGLGLCLWLIKDTITKLLAIGANYSDIGNMRWAFGVILFTFLFHCLFSFPLHLWLLGTFGLIAYCGIRTLSPID